MFLKVGHVRYNSFLSVKELEGMGLIPNLLFLVAAFPVERRSDTSSGGCTAVYLATADFWRTAHPECKE